MIKLKKEILEELKKINYNFEDEKYTAEIKKITRFNICENRLRNNTEIKRVN